MRNLAGTTAATQKDLQAYRIVWLVEIDAEDGGSPVTLRWASREYTLSGNTYADGLAPDGIAMGWATLRERGGLATVSDFTVELAAGAGVQDALAAYTMDGAPIRVYVIFCTGSETSADRVLLQTGTIEAMSWTPQTIQIRAIDKSDRDWREIPTHKVNLGEHPNAPLQEFGQVVPASFGIWAGDADDPDPAYAAMRCLDIYRPCYTPGYNTHPDYSSRPMWGVDAASTVADTGAVLWYNAAYEDAPQPTPIVGVADLDHTIRLAPIMAVDGTNTVDGWSACADNDTATAATIASGELLAVAWQGVQTQGTITAITLNVEAAGGSTGPMAVMVYYGADLFTSYTGTGDIEDDIQPALGDAMVEAWHFESLTITVAPTTAAATEIARIYLVIEYGGYSTASVAAGEPMFMANLDGHLSNLGDQNYLVSGTASTTATGPVAQLAAVMSGRDFFELPAGDFDTDSWEAAWAARDGAVVPYKTRFQLLQAVGWSFWDALCFEAGLHLFPTASGTWGLVARDAGAAPVAYIGPDDIALQDHLDPASPPEVQASLTPVRDVINEIVLRYDYDAVTGEYRAMSARTAQYRYSSDDAVVDAGAKTLTSASAYFKTGDPTAGDFPPTAHAGDRIYIAGKFTVVVTAVNSETELGIEIWARDPAGALANCGPLDYYGGAGVTGAMVESYLRHHTVNPLGGGFDPAEKSGGYTSAVLYADDGDTAEEVLDYMEAWFAQRRMTVEVATFLNAVHLELGDTALLRCPTLPSDRDAEQEGALAGTITAGAGSFTASASGWPGGSAFAAGDYVVIDREAMLVSGVAGNTVSVTRAQAGTTATAHTEAAAIYLAVARWEVSGIRVDAPRAQIRLRLTEKPAE